MANVVVADPLEIPQGNRACVRTSTGILYVCGEDVNTGNIQMWKGNAQPPTQFDEQDAANAPVQSFYSHSAIAIDSADIIHVTYGDFQTGMSASPAVRYATFHTVDAASNPDTWQIDADALALTFNVSISAYFGIAVDANDDVHIMYHDSIASMGNRFKTIFYTNNIAGGGSNFKARVLAHQTDASGDDPDNGAFMIGHPTTAIGADRPIFVQKIDFVSPASETFLAFHGNALDATSFVEATDITNPEESTAVFTSKYDIGQRANGNIILSFARGSPGFEHTVCEHLESDVWGTWQTPITGAAGTTTSSSVFSVDDDFYIVVDSGTQELWKSANGGAWTQITEQDFPLIAGNTPKVKWAKYVDNESSVQMDVVYEVGSGVQWNKFILPAAPVTRTKTFTIDARLVNRIQKTFSIDAILKAIQTKTFSIDAILKAIQTKTFTIDASLVKTFTKTFSIDSILKAVQTKIFSIDAILKAVKTKTFSIDAILETGVVVRTKTFSIDAILKAVQIKSYTIDAILKAIQTKTFSIDAVLRDTFTKTFSLDAILKGKATKTFTIDARLLIKPLKTFSIDAILDGVVQKTFSLDAILTLLKQTKTFTMDAILKQFATKIFTADAILKAKLTKTFSADGVLRDTFTKVFTLDGILSQIATKSFSIDAILKQIRTKTFTMDAILVVEGVDQLLDTTEINLISNSITDLELVSNSTSDINLISKSITEIDMKEDQ